MQVIARTKCVTVWRRSPPNRQFLKIFIDRGYGKNVVIGNGRNQAKFTFKGLCFAAVKLIAAGLIASSAIEYEPCREHVERAMKESKRLH